MKKGMTAPPTGGAKIQVEAADNSPETAATAMEISDHNREIWDKVKTTNPDHTKGGKVSGMDITAINGTSVVMKATEVWGPMGKGWGVDIKEERFIDGAPMMNKETKDVLRDGNMNPIHAVLHSCLINVWYKDDPSSDTKYYVPHYGQTPFVQMTKYGPTTDFDVQKKSLTDAIKKALSMLGFNADIFLGQYDDREYVQVLQEQSRVEKAEDRAVEQEAIEEERKEWYKTNLATLSTATTDHELDTIAKGMQRRLKAIGSNNAKLLMVAVEKARAKRQDQIQLSKPELKGEKSNA